jgi:hypothetical protein
MQGRAVDSLELTNLGIIPLFVVRTLPDGTESRSLSVPSTVLEAPSELVVLGPRDQVSALKQKG